MLVLTMESYIELHGLDGLYEIVVLRVIIVGEISFVKWHDRERA